MVAPIFALLCIALGALLSGPRRLALVAALVVQFAYCEAPCPLCLLERIGVSGACFGLIMNVRPGPPARAAGPAGLLALLLAAANLAAVPHRCGLGACRA